MPRKRSYKFFGANKVALIDRVKHHINNDLWEEYTEDDLAHYLCETEGVNFKLARDIVFGTMFIIELETEIEQRIRNDTLCECVPLLSPYATQFVSLTHIARMVRFSHKATPYTCWAIASMTTLRIYHKSESKLKTRYGKGVNQDVAYYLGYSGNKRKHALFHSNLRYKKRFCQERYWPIMLKTMNNLTYDMVQTINQRKGSYLTN